MDYRVRRVLRSRGGSDPFTNCQRMRVQYLPSHSAVEFFDHTVKVFDVSSNKIRDMQLEEYIKGVVAAEMPASFGIEALKSSRL